MAEFDCYRRHVLYVAAGTACYMLKKIAIAAVKPKTLDTIVVSPQIGGIENRNRLITSIGKECQNYFHKCFSFRTTELYYYYESLSLTLSTPKVA